MLGAGVTEKVLIDDHARRKTASELREESLAKAADRERAIDAQTMNPLRLSRRAELREKLAQAKLAEVRLREVDCGISELESRKEAAAAVHAAKCNPIQSKLAELEQRQLASIKAKQPLDDSIEDERRELLTELGEANAELQSSVDATDRLIEQLQKDRLDVAKACNACVVKMELTRSCSPATQLELVIAQNAEKWASARVKTAEEKLSDQRAFRRGDDRVFVAELEDAMSALVSAQERVRVSVEKSIEE